MHKIEFNCHSKTNERTIAILKLYFSPLVINDVGDSAKLNTCFRLILHYKIQYCITKYKVQCSPRKNFEHHVLYVIVEEVDKSPEDQSVALFSREKKEYV